MTSTRTSDFLKPEGGWSTAVQVRIPPPPPAQRGLLFRAVSRLTVLLGRPDLPDIFPVMHVHPGLFWPWLLFASRLMPFGKLSAGDREKIILRTGWNCRSRYEWGQHVEIGLAAGLTDADIVRVARGPAAWADPHARALMLACDELCGDNCISDATWQTLSEKYDDVRRIEITMLIGHYRMIAGFLNSSGIALEPPLEQVLQNFYKRAGQVSPGD